MSFDKIVIERSSSDRWARNPPRRRPRLGEMPSGNREGSRRRLQGSQRPPRVPRGHTLEAKHGHSRSIMYQEVHQRAERLGHCHRSPTHCSSCCAGNCLPLRYKHYYPLTVTRPQNITIRLYLLRRTIGRGRFAQFERHQSSATSSTVGSLIQLWPCLATVCDQGLGWKNREHRRCSSRARQTCSCKLINIVKQPLLNRILNVYYTIKRLIAWLLLVSTKAARKERPEASHCSLPTTLIKQIWITYFYNYF